MVCCGWCVQTIGLSLGFVAAGGEGVPLPLPFSAPLPQESSFVFIRFPYRPRINQKAWNARASHFLVWNVAKNVSPNKNALASLRPPRPERNGRERGQSSGLGELVEELLLVGVVELRHEGDGLDLGEAFVEAWLHVLLLEPVIVGQV